MSTEAEASTCTSESSSDWKLPDVNSPAWIEIPCSDVQRAKTFYSTVFDFQFRHNTPDYPSDSFAMFITKNPSIMGALLKAKGEGSETHSPGLGGVKVYLRVEDVQEALERVVKAGGKVVQEMFQEGNHTQLAQYADTEGNVGGILKWLEGEKK
jgi:predicted enzyme related to lactoylglutathione lyase